MLSSGSSASPGDWTTAWVEQYGDALLRYIRLYVKDAGLAQDIAQETFARLYQFRCRHPGRSVTASWLYTVARRLVIDHSRYEKVRPTVSLEGRGADAAPVSQDEASGVVQKAHVQAILDRMPAKERECLVLFYFQDWSLEEIAAHLNQRPVTVRVRLHRARDRFRKIWKEDGVDE